MTKKTIFSRLTLAAVLAIASTGFIACGDDNDEPEVPATRGSSYVIAFEFNEDVINTADITAHIAKPDGTFSEEKVTKPNVSWTLTGNKLPDKAGVLLTFVPKNDIDPAKVYDISIKGSIAVSSLKNNKVVEYESYGKRSHMTVKGERLPEYYRARGIGFAHGINTNGELVKVDVDTFDFGLNGLWQWVAGWLSDSK